MIAERQVTVLNVLGMHVRYDIANVYNPAFSVGCRLEKSVLAGFAKR